MFAVESYAAVRRFVLPKKGNLECTTLAADHAWLEIGLPWPRIKAKTLFTHFVPWNLSLT